MREPLGGIEIALIVGVAVVMSASVGVGAVEEETADVARTGMGEIVFKGYCRSCHGSEAKGDGPVSEYLNVKPANLTAISERNDGEFPFDKVFKAIEGGKPVRGHGNSEMPVWGDALKKIRDGQTEEEVREKITDLVHYLWSIQG